MKFYDHHFRRRGGGSLGKWKDSREDGRLLEHVLQLPLDKKPKIIEVGPGLGRFAEHCKAQEIDYEAVEPNERQAAHIQSLGYPVYRTLAPPLPVPGDHYDVFYASQVIEHMPNRLVAVEFVSEAMRVVRPGGWVVLTAPVISSWKEVFWDDYTHNYPTSPRRLVTMFQDLELEEIRVVRYCSSFFGLLRYLVIGVGLLFPYRLLDRMTGSSVKQGFLFNLKVATLERFMIAGRVAVAHATRENPSSS